MIRHIFYTEIKRLYRDSGVAVVSLLVAILLIFALANGASYTKKRSNNISAALNEQQLDDERTKQKLDSVQRGLITGLDSWVNPETPSYIANRKARIAAMPANTFSLISTGQSDIYAFYVKPTFSSESYMLSFSELANPVQLLFGNFDLAFAIVYLLPLIAIALSYNILSEEKEYGRYRLLASQPISDISWLLVRILARSFFLVTVVVASMLVGFALFGKAVFSQPLQLLQLFFITSIYLWFWFAASFVVNYFSAASGTNAIRLVTVWVVFVLMMPSVIHQLASSIYVVPSRALMVNEVREAKADASKKADAILKSYYRDHPELAPADSTQKNPYGYWVSYIASQELIKKQLEPIVSDFDLRLAAQQQWVEKLRVISPALLVQNSLHALAGTSAAHYADYRKQVISFADEWKAFFAPKFFTGDKVTVGDLELLPSFTYTERVANPVRADVTGLLIYSLFTFLFGLLMYVYGRGHRSINGSPA